MPATGRSSRPESSNNDELLSDDDEASGRHGLGCLHVQLVAEADVERAGDHGEVRISWVGVWLERGSRRVASGGT